MSPQGVLTTLALCSDYTPRGWYDPIWPAYVVHDDPGSLTFTIALGTQEAALSRPLAGASIEVEGEDTRRWVTRQSVVRLHQRSFRLRVMQAYSERCAICRLESP